MSEETKTYTFEAPTKLISEFDTRIKGTFDNRSQAIRELIKRFLGKPGYREVG